MSVCDPVLTQNPGCDSDKSPPPYFTKVSAEQVFHAQASSVYHSLSTSESLQEHRAWALDSPGAALLADLHQQPSLCRGAPLAGGDSTPESRNCHPGCTGIPQCLHSHIPPFWQASPHTRIQEKRAFDFQAPCSVTYALFTHPTHFRPFYWHSEAAKSL